MSAMTPRRLLDMLYEHDRVFAAFMDDGYGNLKQARYFSSYEEAGAYGQHYCEVRAKKGGKAGFAIVESKILADA